jgi:hypothetical protein
LIFHSGLKGAGQDRSLVALDSSYGSYGFSGSSGFYGSYGVLQGSDRFIDNTKKPPDK